MKKLNTDQNRTKIYVSNQLREALGKISDHGIKTGNSNAFKAIDSVLRFELSRLGYKVDENFQCLIALSTGEIIVKRLDSDPEGCRCQACDRLYTIDLIISDELWEMVKPEGKAEGAGLLCPTCILERVADKTGYTGFDMQESIITGDKWND